MIKVILWDIDGTLLNFTKVENYAMKKCFEMFDMGVCTDEMVERYAAVNKKYWERLERGELTKAQILTGRFREFFRGEGLPGENAEAFNKEYQVRLGDKAFFNDNGEELVIKLKAKVKQYAVTNGTLTAQRGKLAKSGLDKLLDGVFISDEIGIEKPNAGFFDYVFCELAKGEDYEKNEILIIGDSLTSDIQGGNNAGILCCWYNPAGNTNTKGLRIDYEIRNLQEVEEIITGMKL
ncbi:MAG: YjjG family noncanonical pyrimidine nucleotidase [Lachnospiraceae bacterium]|nr:YjjG family noncanonical pyrimidine nucleotidase [Lachnospiraceae bacterium]MBO5146834.1 YjjG family noncanonical pyrimidine nucleotidase [Lachnospiraceae bacterium]